MIGNSGPRRVYYQMSTNNKSFLNMHYYLKDIGIEHNKFMLALLDPDLLGVDPYDPRLNRLMMQKVFREVCNNYWYFLREVVRIPDSGGMGQGARYRLDRGNLALNFCMACNMNIFLELPRQLGKTISALCRYLYLFNFGTTHSEMAFLNKRLEDSKLNLARLKELREALPSYLQMSEVFTADNKKIKATNTVISLNHPLNGNKIRTSSSANSKAQAASILRGRTIPLIYMDEFAFMKHNETIYLNGVPAFRTAADNAKRNGAPFGMLITTTPGFLTEDEGIVAYNFKNDATPFSERWYDWPLEKIQETIASNYNSNFVYIKFTYQELGQSEEWFARQCVEMQRKWPDIRREILLEWSFAPDNSPFTQEQLDAVRELVKSPINQVIFLGKYIMNIYEMIDLRFPPIIGVDVSGGYRRDSSAIACIDSRTTKLFADMNCNYIPPTDLATVIYQLVTTRLPNAIVNVERNGGFGSSVLAALIPTNIKRNLYYEIKDKIIEETSSFSGKVRKVTEKRKVFGTDSTHEVRETLIQILRERMEYHKDKFVSPKIYEELRGMEIKRSGKVEHSDNTHDDSVFALLMALYVWYEGKDVMQRYGIQKQAIKTDSALEEAVFSLEDKTNNILLNSIYEDPDDPIMKDLAAAEKAKGKLYYEWAREQVQKDQEALDELLTFKPAREAWARKYNTPIEELEKGGLFNIPNNIFKSFYEQQDDDHPN